MRVMSTMRTQAINSDQDINDGMAEIELQKLQRQYRIMEGDRKAYSEESRILISKQRESVEKLKKDNQHLIDELQLLEQRNEAHKKVGAQSKKAEELSEQSEFYQRKTRLVIAEIGALDHAIGLMNREIDEQRAKLGGVNAASQNNEAIDKQIRVLENRLDKALVKFNNALAVNKSLRGSIDNLRRERLVFDNIYRKFERELMEQKKQMADVIEMSNAAYEARDEAQAKIIAFREKAEKESQNYIQEMKELERTLEQDRKLKEFMATKISDRSEKVESFRSGDPKMREKDVTMSTKFASTEVLAESLDEYEHAFEDIRKVTQIKDIGELVQKFKEVEDQNFSLFNFVNEINNEIEIEAEGIVSLQRKIDNINIEGIEDEEKRKQTLGALESKLNDCETKRDFYQTQRENANRLLGDISQGIEGLLEAFATTSADNAAGETEQITSTNAEKPGEDKSQTNPTNLFQILADVEIKANELLTFHLAVNAPKNRNTLVIGDDGIPKEVSALPGGAVGGLLGQGPTAPLSKLSIIAPSTGDDHDSDDNLTDEDERPLSREEIRIKTIKGISKREKTSGLTAAAKIVTQKTKRKTNKKSADN